MAVKSYSYSDKTQLTKHYNVQEFKCKGTTKHDIKIDSELPKWLEKIMPLIGAKTGNIYSGYRCAEHDKNVGGAGSGSHVMGYAADIWFKDKNGNRINSTKVALALEDIGYPYGIGWRCGGSNPETGNIHIDTRPRKIYMDESKSMNKSISILAAPSDGKTGHTSYLTYIYKPITYYINANSGLNVRNEKSTSSKIVGFYEWGKAINVYYIEDGWAKVGVAKWVSADYIQKDKPIKQEKIVDKIVDEIIENPEIDQLINETVEEVVNDKEIDDLINEIIEETDTTPKENLENFVELKENDVSKEENLGVAVDIKDTQPSFWQRLIEFLKKLFKKK